MEDSANTSTRRSEFQVKKYDGSKVKWNSFIDDIKAAIQAHHSSRDKGIKYLFTDWPKDEDNPGEYLIDSKYVTVEEPDHLEFDVDATVKQRQARIRQIDAIRGINLVVTKLKAKIMEILQDRVTSSMISVFNAQGSDPYRAYRWLCETHGPESQGITAKVNSVDVCIDLKMDKDARFSAFYSEFTQHIDMIKGNDILALALLWTNKEHNSGGRQMLPDRLMKEVDHCRREQKDYESSVAYILGVDNDYHERHGACCGPKGAVARGLQAKTTREDNKAGLICFNCNKTGHVAADCRVNLCGYCGKKGHKSDVCRERLANVADKLKKTAKKKQQKEESEEEEASPPPKAKATGGRKRLRSHLPTKVQKVKQVHYESQDEMSSEDESEGEEPPARRRMIRSAMTKEMAKEKGTPERGSKKLHPGPWDRQVRSLQSKNSQVKQVLNKKTDSKYQGILDSGADESCTPYKDILMGVNRSNNSSKNKVILTSASGHRLDVSMVGDISSVLTDVLVSHDLDTTLLSTKKISQKGIGTWIPPAGSSKHIGAVLIRDDGMVMGVADKNMSLDVRSIQDTGIKVALPDLALVKSAPRIPNLINNSMVRMVDGVTRYQYGLGRMPIADQVAFIQKTMMCSKKDLLFMANGAIDNFPVTAAQVNTHWSEDVCWLQGHFKKRKTDRGQFEDLSEMKEIESMVMNDSKPVKDQVLPISSDELKMLEPRNLVMGMEVGTDIFGPLLGATIVTAVDKCSGYGISQKLQKGKKGLATAIEEIVDLYEEQGHPIQTLCSDSEAAYKTHEMVMGVLRQRKIKAKYSAPYQKSYNGLAEVHHNIIRSKATSMMCCALHLPQQFWVGAWYQAEVVNNLRQSRLPGSTVTRFEEFYGVKPDFKKRVMAPFGHPVLYRVPKERREPGLTAKGRLGVYIGPADAIEGGIRVYSYKTKRVIETDTYELLAAVPNAWIRYGRELFAQDDADLEAILIDSQAEGRITRGRAYREEQARKAREDEDLTSAALEDAKHMSFSTDVKGIVDPESIDNSQEGGVTLQEGVDRLQEGAEQLANGPENQDEDEDAELPQEGEVIFNLDSIAVRQSKLSKRKKRDSRLTVARHIVHVNSLTNCRKSTRRAATEGKIDYREDRTPAARVQDLYSLPGLKRKNLFLGPSLIDGAGTGVFNGPRLKRNGSLVTDFSGLRFTDELAARHSNSDSIFQAPVGNIFVVGDKSSSYGPWINDPLDADKTNCRLLYNTRNDTFEVYVLESDIEPHSEIYIAYGADYWKSHLDKAPIDQITRAYPGILESEEYFRHMRNHRTSSVDREGEQPSDSKRQKVEDVEEFSSRAINRIGRIYQREFLSKRALRYLQENYEGPKRGGRRSRINKKALDKKGRVRKMSRHKLRKIVAHKKKTRGFDNPSLSQAKKREDWPKWKEAMDTEYQQMFDDGVFEEHLGPFPEGANIIGAMIVLQIKRNQDGSIDKYKARLVCLGNQQDESSYDAIKSGTARSSTVKLIISLQAKTRGVSMVLDVKGAYLKSHIREELNEKLYVVLPDKRVMKLKKYLYGLKQAGYEWERNVTACLVNAGYSQSEADPRTFSLWVGERYAVMCLHVDDFFVMASDTSMLEDVYQVLIAEYGQVTIKDGDLLAYLGMQVSIDQSSGVVTLSQPAYTRKLLDIHLGESTSQSPARVCKTPMTCTDVIRERDNDPIDQREYLMVVGGLNYLAQYTRPDILYAMSIVAQRCSCPTVGDMKMVQRILRYIEDTVDYGLQFNPGPVSLICHVDAAHNCYEDGRGHYGYSFTLGYGDGSFFAKSKKMKLTTLSSTESEYVALCEATREAVWLRRLLSDIGFTEKRPTLMWQDNKSTIDMVKGHRSYQASKHINPKFHYTGEMVEMGEICLEYLPTDKMIADVLTKALPSVSHIKLTNQLLNHSDD